MIHHGGDGGGNDNHKEGNEKDVDDNDHPPPQLRAEEDSARKIGGADADDGGRGDKEGLNLKVPMKQNQFETQLSKSPCSYIKIWPC